jgi:2-amino-4-hydroxy-6-hydroxymethyldihydropteridine diphosphokinase
LSTSASRAVDRVAIALGSNLGDRLENLRFGLARLRLVLGDGRISSVYETEPRHDPEQPRFLNACVTGTTRLTARQLLSELHDAERAAGRRRTGRRWGPRTLDLDLLLYGTSVIREPGLVVPHPRLHERVFVLEPLAEIASDWAVPLAAGEVTTVDELARRIDHSGIERLEEAL